METKWIMCEILTTIYKVRVTNEPTSLCLVGDCLSAEELVNTCGLQRWENHTCLYKLIGGITTLTSQLFILKLLFCDLKAILFCVIS